MWSWAAFRSDFLLAMTIVSHIFNENSPSTAMNDACSHKSTLSTITKVGIIASIIQVLAFIISERLCRPGWQSLPYLCMKAALAYILFRFAKLSAANAAAILFLDVLQQLLHCERLSVSRIYRFDLKPFQPLHTGFRRCHIIHN